MYITELIAELQLIKAQYGDKRSALAILTAKSSFPAALNPFTRIVRVGRTIG